MKLEFTECPNCDSTRQLCKELTEEAKAAGHGNDTWSMRFDVKKGVAVDRAKEPFLPIGEELTGFLVKTDICMDCGTIYAVEIITEVVKKTKVIDRPGNFTVGNS